MNEEKTLTVVEQRDVIFYDDELTAVRAADGHIYVAIRQMCDALGVDDRSQRRRIQSDTVLGAGYQRGVISTPHRGDQQAGLLRVDLVPLWLAGIRTKIVKEEIRPKLERFQREAAAVLWDAFREGRLALTEPFDDLLENQADSPDVQAYKMAMAIMKMARQQILLRQQIESHTVQLGNHEHRIEAIEVTLGDSARYITPAQASRISQAVKAIAMELGKRSGRNEFGGVYGEVYRRFEIAGYRELPAAKYDEAMRFLRDWYVSLTGKDVPF